MVMISVNLFLGFIVGAFSIIVVEALIVLYVIRRLIGPTKSAQLAVATSPLHSHQTLPSLCQKQGVIWILDPEKHPKIPVLTGDQNKKRDIVEVSPVQKLAEIKDDMLILTKSDGSFTKINLKGCSVSSVSASSLPTRKWAKRYPIKIENEKSVLYKGSNVFYMYTETSWEKESWCKALRLSSSNDNERRLWFHKISEEFKSYLKSLSDSYPSLFKPLGSYQSGQFNKANRFDDPPTKVQQLWRKVSKTFVPNLDEKRIADKSHSLQDCSSLLSSTKNTFSGKMGNECKEESSSISSGPSGSSVSVSENSNAKTSEKFVIDEGTFCWNLLISRLFFDAKSNMDIRTSLKAHIQKSLSTMRIPTYIGEVTCTGVDPGNFPPYIHAMRAVPTDMNDVWAIEMDIEYSGGVALYIETRLEVCEFDPQNGSVDINIESTKLLEDFKHLQEDFEHSDGKNGPSERKDSEHSKLEMLRSSRTGVSTANSGSRWKSLLNSVAKHVSQVPLTLTIKVATLRGAIQLHMKPPPCDQLWVGFTCMPDIEFELESSVKDHKVTSGRVASFLINRFKASIRETLVLPNSECVGVSWMLAEKDDWVPRSAAPFLWPNHEPPTNTSSNEASISRGKRTEGKDINEEKSGQVVPYTTTTLQTSVSSQDMKAPLLGTEEVRDTDIKQKNTEYVSLREQKSAIQDDDGKPKRVGRRARMLDLRKKMGEKIEGKRRHIEEKGRHIVEKMRGP